MLPSTDDTLHSQWRSRVDEALIKGADLDAATINELARRGVRFVDLLDMPPHRKVKELFALGWAKVDIAYTVGLPGDWIDDTLDGVSDHMASILDCHAAGATVAQIADTVGLSRAWVYKVLNRRYLQPNIKPGRARELSARKKAEVLRRWKAGEPTKTIASRTGATIRQVQYIAHQAHDTAGPQS